MGTRSLRAMKGEAPAVPEPPGWLDPEAQDLWRRLAPGLLHRGYLEDEYTEKFAACCQAWAAWLDAERTLAREGRTITTPSGFLRAHPAVGLAREALRTFDRLGRLFGLSPADSMAVPRPREHLRPSSWS